VGSPWFHALAACRDNVSKRLHRWIIQYILLLVLVLLAIISSLYILLEDYQNAVKWSFLICSNSETSIVFCPPIREKANQEGLWEELCNGTADGVIKTVVSDHSLCTPNLKLLPPALASGFSYEDVEGAEGDFSALGEASAASGWDLAFFGWKRRGAE
jgi:hypothetical protein